MIDLRATAAHVQAVAVMVYDAAVAHAVEMLGTRIASTAPAGTLAALEDAKAVWALEGNNALLVSFITDMSSARHYWNLSTGSGSIFESTAEIVDYARPPDVLE